MPETFANATRRRPVGKSALLIGLREWEDHLVGTIKDTAITVGAALFVRGANYVPQNVPEVGYPRPQRAAGA